MPKVAIKRSPKAVTIREVAKEAGVSVSTVSRVLNGKDDISEKTVKKVLAVVQELGYASSLAARGMRSHRTNVIGLIMPNVALYYSQEILRGVNRAITKLDTNLIIYTSGVVDKENIARHERSYVALLNGGITDGAVVVTPMATQFTTNAPLVIIDPNTETPDHPSIVATNREGALEAMKYLAGLGHRRIGHITGNMEQVISNERLLGYKEGLCAAGIPLNQDWIEIGDYTAETAVDCARRLLSLPERPTAIFAANDLAAMGVYQVAGELGLRIPADLSVIGYDNLHETAYLNPPLTTVDQFIEQMGAVATEMLAKLVNGEPLPANPAGESNLYKIPTRLVIRNSCAAPP
ncbi:MAG: LacI family DNA-binding transcriptional regulator [Anaerolineales bacterium]|nr:LacI family DNA-binding transcriptional regulator [Anaerolineales bacterium]